MIKPQGARELVQTIEVALLNAGCLIHVEPAQQEFHEEKVTEPQLEHAT